MNGSELYQYILDNTLHELKGTWEVTQDNELKVTGTDVNGSYVVFPDALTNFSLEWDMTILSSGGNINSGISPIILSSYQGSNLEGWNNGSTVTNAKFMYFICNHRSTTNFGSICVFNNGASQGNWMDSGYQDTFIVGTKYRYKLERKNGLFKLYQDNTLVSSFTDLTNNIPIYLGWYMWYGGSFYSGYQANFIIDNYVVTDLSTDTTKYLNGTGLSEVWTNTKNYISAQLLGKSDVGHTHSDYIPRSGGAVFSGQRYQRTVDNDSLYFYGGQGWGHGGMIALFGKNEVNSAGKVFLIPSSSENIVKFMTVAPNGTWTWDGTACQITSDQRFKQQISNIDDKLLDAWEDVELSQFKYNDAVEEKSDNARLHTGYVVQQIDEACKSHNVDISKYGLYCHEEYAEETREIEHEDGTKAIEVVRPASEHYSLRYTEALIVECAYLRKCIKELRSEIEELKSSK